MGDLPEPLSLDAIDVPAGWTPVKEIPDLRPSTAFLSSEERVAVRYFTRDTDDALVGFVRFGVGTEGPPGHAHGGSMASVLDEAMGFACWIHGHPVLAARIEVDFRAPLPIPQVVKATGIITSVDGRKISARGLLEGLDGTVYSESTGLFIELSAEAVANMG